MKILKEPLVLFLLLGGTAFAVLQFASDESGDSASSSAEIVVGPGQIRALSLNFEKTRLRSPTDRELNGLMESYIREEILYREARALGLDQNDAVIKRILRQKLEFVLMDVAQLDPPDDEQLKAFLQANAEDYREQSVFSFRQVHVPQGERDRSFALLEQLRAGEVEPGDLHRTPLLPDRFEKQITRDVERVMGLGFVSYLSQVPTGSWQGPVESGFGYHLVYLAERTAGKIPELEAIRDVVSRDWLTQKRKDVNEAYYETLRERYTVRIENGPADDDNDTGLSEQAALGEAQLSVAKKAAPALAEQ